MELIKLLTNDVNFDDCATQVEVASLVNQAIEDLGIEAEEVLDQLASELDLGDIGELFSDFDDLPDANLYKEALYDALQFEEMQGKYPWDIADVVVGVLMLHASPELQEQLRDLPYRGE
jgi:hypothetical protein